MQKSGGHFGEGPAPGDPERDAEQKRTQLERNRLLPKLMRDFLASSLSQFGYYTFPDTTRPFGLMCCQVLKLETRDCKRAQNNALAKRRPHSLICFVRDQRMYGWMDECMGGCPRNGCMGGCSRNMENLVETHVLDNI